ncbi:centromere protein T isoform X2 [Alligator mississippiensis]|uniref:Centromere protein T n=1 Tax=Alligator mississippiensis TaxID=8496 RepID=A0A151NJK9_ALLMI|nr:centromere protein T isoform X2 [Alligator mississippiensis]KYO36978.1 centromere protein T isoform B [Alligator mississippiensis]
MPDPAAAPRTSASAGLGHDSGVSPSAVPRRAAEEWARPAPRRKHLSDSRKQKPTMAPDLETATPRLLLRKIFQTQPEVSPVVPKITEPWEPRESGSETHSERLSNTMKIQLPDLVSEDTAIITFHTSRNKRKLSISEFERAVDKRSSQNLAKSMSDDKSSTRSLQASFSTPVPPNTIEKRGLLRRPKNRKTVNVDSFEGGVEQNLLQIKDAENYLVDSQAVSMIGTTVMMNDTKIALNNTELFVQPQLSEKSQGRLSALEPQLLARNVLERGSRAFNTAEPESQKEHLASNVDPEEEMVPEDHEDSALDHADRSGPASVGKAGSPPRDHQDYAQQSSYAEQVSGLVSGIQKEPLTLNVNPEEEMVQGDHEDSALYHTDRSSPASMGKAGSLPKDQQDCTQQSSYAEQVSGLVSGTFHRQTLSTPAVTTSRGRHLGSLSAQRSTRTSLREFVAHVIEKLNCGNEDGITDTEQEIVKDGAEKEGIAREVTELQSNMEYSEKLGEKLRKQTTSHINEKRQARTPVTPVEEEVMIEDAENQNSGKDVVEFPENAGARRLSRQSSAAFTRYSEPTRKKSIEPVEQTVDMDDGAVVEDTSELEEHKTEEEELSEDGAKSEELSMEMPAFVHAMADQVSLSLSTPRSLKMAVPKLSPKPPPAKQAPKKNRTEQRRKREPALPSSLVKKIFRHYVKMPVARDVFKVVEKCSEQYFKQLSNDLEAYTKHAGRKTVERADLELLMRRQGLVTDEMPLNVLIERHLPLEYRKLLIPVATSGNKVIPSK